MNAPPESTQTHLNGSTIHIRDDGMIEVTLAEPLEFSADTPTMAISIPLTDVPNGPVLFGVVRERSPDRRTLTTYQPQLAGGEKPTTFPNPLRGYLIVDHTTYTIGSRSSTPVL